MNKDSLIEQRTSDDELAEAPYEAEIILVGIEQYKQIALKMQEQVRGLAQAGTMSQNVAQRILDEFSYNAFQQLVKVEYR